MRRKSDCGDRGIVLPPDFGKMKRNHSLDRTNELDDFAQFRMGLDAGGGGGGAGHQMMGGSYRQLPQVAGQGRMY